MITQLASCDHVPALGMMCGHNATCHLLRTAATCVCACQHLIILPDNVCTCTICTLHMYYVTCTFIFTAGVWGVGLATPTVQVDTVPLGGDANSWVLTSEGTCLHGGQVVSRITQGQLPAEGDIIVSLVVATCYV